MGAFRQFLVADTAKRMQDFSVREARHAEGLRGHTGGGGKLLCTYHGCCLATLFNHQSIVHTARATGPSITDADQDGIVFVGRLIEKRGWRGPIGTRLAIVVQGNA